MHRQRRPVEPEKDPVQLLVQPPNSCLRGRLHGAFFIASLLYDGLSQGNATLVHDNGTFSLRKSDINVGRAVVH
jgi:hypothetical protein